MPHPVHKIHFVYSSICRFRHIKFQDGEKIGDVSSNFWVICRRIGTCLDLILPQFAPFDFLIFSSLWWQLNQAFTQECDRRKHRNWKMDLHQILYEIWKTEVIYFFYVNIERWRPSFLMLRNTVDGTVGKLYINYYSKQKITAYTATGIESTN